MLTDLDVAAFADPKQSFAERLGQWLDFTGAISLSAALKAGAAWGADGRPGPQSSGAVGIREDVVRVQAALVEAISSNDPLRVERERMGSASASPDGAPDFSPFHRHYLAQQRGMEGSISPLRARVRAALSELSPELRQLAALDAVMEEALQARERNLFMTVPLLLEKRFERLRGQHLALLAETQGLDDPEFWVRPGGWLARFCGDMQALLLAELDLRLQPVLGLVEAIGNKVIKQQ